VGVALLAALISLIIAGICGWIVGFLGALVYNVSIKYIGGLKVVIKEEEIIVEEMDDRNQHLPL
jgi:hypothetical protein